MGILLGIVVLSLVVALVAAGPLLAYRGAIRVLARERARMGAYLLLGVPAIIGASFVMFWWFAGLEFDGRFAFIASVATSALVSRGYRQAIALTGGPLDPTSVSEAGLRAHLAAAERHLQRGDQASWRAALEAAAAAWDTGTVAIRDAIRALLSATRRDGSPKEVRTRRKALERAIEAHWSAPRPVRLVAVATSSLVLFGVFGWSLATAVSARQACIGSDLPSGRVSSGEMHTAGAIADSLLTDPEPRAELLTDLALDLDLAAESRHDPDAREQLEEAGFAAGHLREWWAFDGRLIHVDAFEFQDTDGALEYQRSVTRYACDFANVHFDAPGGGVGLQVRYNTGDPIVEQVSWVAGNRRYLVSVGHLAPPSDHTRIIEIYERTAR